MRIGSLFDGSGGFPSAGALCGIEPVWAAEVEPYPIAVTRSRFPKMKHLGSVTDIKGAEVEPVDIITFGSPCQDLSVAGKRAGLKHEDNGDEETTRSGLFMEAVRIIKEMREATNGEYPTFALWENVPGAFSSNRGEDFRIVLEELIKIAEPRAVMPAVPQRGWAYADSYCGDGWSLAYRVFDAQHWGVPQRRRRIYLVADLRGERAREVLFERESLRGYFAESRTPWQAAPSYAERSVGADDCTGILDCLPFDTTQVTSPQNRNNPKWGDPCHPLAAQGHPPTVIMRAADDREGAVGLDCYNQSLTGDKAKTLNSAASDADHIPCVTYAVKTWDARGNGGGDTVSALTGDHENRITDYTSVICLQGNGIDRADTAGCNGRGWNDETCYTLNTIDRPAVVYCIGNGQVGQAYPKELVGALNCMHDQQAIIYKEEVIAIDRAAFNQGQNAQYEPQFYTDGTTSTLVAKGPSAVAYVDTTHADDVVRLDDTVAPLQARDYKGGKLVQIRYIVRRLTPTECARLLGFPDTWGHPAHKEDFTDEEYRFWLEVRNTHAAINGKATKSYTREQMVKWYNGLHTDSAEYKMWGNGIALPTALYCMQGIAEALVK